MANSFRCAWCGSDPLYVAYHDQEWGVPERDSRALWEKLVLDGFQAGLSWITILRKREAFRAAFAGFDPEKVARFDEADVARLLADPGIVRSRAKIDVGHPQRAPLSRHARARRATSLRGCGASWTGSRFRTPGTSFAGPRGNAAVARAFQGAKAEGFNFTGPVIVYAWMQATGLVNDHLVGCFRHDEVRSMAGAR